MDGVLCVVAVAAPITKLNRCEPPSFLGLAILEQQEPPIIQ